ncbi:MAG TPA: hypothetical protein DHL02_12785 [Achromobacter sp.]|nr:hypothetical protein [Achromobacter sp.]
MRKVLVAVSITLAHVAPAMAECMGTDALSTCFDDNGNSYLVQRMGNMTFVDGTNPQTGSAWSQTSQTLGNMTIHNGTAADGNTWNSTTQTFGDQTFTYGTDSRGNTFSNTCNQFGCF